MTQELKYKVGQEVWVVVGDEPFCTEIIDCFYNDDGVFCHYEVDQKDGLISKNFHEDFLYPSEYDLIKAQITHWKNLDIHRETTKPFPLYKISQRVWYSVDVDIFSFSIERREWYEDGNTWMYYGEGEAMSEPNLFPCRESLILDQIKYWLGLSEKSATEILCNEIESQAQEKLDYWKNRCKHTSEESIINE